jgi:uroporphyrinogen-III synthase
MTIRTKIDFGFLGGWRKHWVGMVLLFLSSTNIRPNDAFVLLHSSITTTSYNSRKLYHRLEVSRIDNDPPIDGGTVVVVATTREEGKNDQLRQRMENDHPTLWNQLSLLELPCIAHALGPDYDKLSSTLLTSSSSLSQNWDYIAVTSPEAAKVLVSAWKNKDDDDNENDSATSVVRTRPSSKLTSVAAVGKATEKILAKNNVVVSFVPSKATAETLAKELPLLPAGKDGTTTSTTVLYPASVRAKTTLQDRLTERGFDVTRLNTYDTVTATWTDTQRDAAQTVQVACFASPSSVKGWLHNTNNNTRVIAACIGITSATACKELGWDDHAIFYPEEPGMEGWVETIKQAMKVAKRERTSHHTTTNTNV